MDIIEKIRGHIKDNVTPLWLEGFAPEDFSSATKVLATAPKTEFAVFMGSNGAVYPNWYKAVMAKKQDKINLLVFDRVDKLTEEEQERFLEIVKYRTVSNVKLPKNCVVILTTSKSNNGKINEKLRRFLTFIKA